MVSYLLRRRRPYSKMTLKAGVVMVSPDTKQLLVVINRGATNPLKFGLPKGHVEKSELVSHCAVRELREETGLVVKLYKSDYKMVVAETTYYFIKAHSCITPSPQDDTEIAESRWVYWEDIMKTDCNRGLRLLRDKLRKKDNALMTRLMKLKPRKIEKNRALHKQIRTHETHMGPSKPVIYRSYKDDTNIYDGFSKDEDVDLP